MRRTRPDDTAKIAYEKFGPHFGKKKFYKFIDEALKSLNVKLDTQVFSYMIIEETLIDGEPYLELSLNKDIHLPIAGSQYSILEIQSLRDTPKIAKCHWLGLLTLSILF